MFTPQPIGFVASPFKDTAAIPKGLGAKHEAEGALNILPAFELGLTDIEGYSHLIVLWAFDRVDGFDLMAAPPSDTRAHGVFSTRSPRRPNPIGLTVVELLGREGGSLRVRGVCSTERPFSTSSLTFPASLRRPCAVDGWRRLKLESGDCWRTKRQTASTNRLVNAIAFESLLCVGFACCGITPFRNSSVTGHDFSRAAKSCNK